MRHFEVWGHAVALCTIIIWGLTFVSTKILLLHLTPLQILFSRFLLGYAALWLMHPRHLPWQGLRVEGLFAAAGLIGVTLYFLFENIALTYTVASNVAVIVTASPFFTSLLAWLILKTEKPGVNFYAGFFLAMLGISLISFRGAEFRFNPLGDMLALLAAIMWAFYSIITRKLAMGGYNLIQMTRRIFFYGLMLMLPIDPSNLAHLPVETLLGGIPLANILFLGIGASALCFAAWSYSLKVLGAAAASAYIYLVPVVTVIFAAIILDEPLSLFSMAGICLTITGLMVAEYRTGRHLSSRHGTLH